MNWHLIHYDYVVSKCAKQIKERKRIFVKWLHWNVLFWPFDNYSVLRRMKPNNLLVIQNTSSLDNYLEILGKCACVAHGWTSGWHSGWSLERQNVKSAWQLKMVMLWNERFLPFVKMICTERKFRVKNGGLSCGTYLIYNTKWGGGGISIFAKFRSRLSYSYSSNKLNRTFQDHISMTISVIVK